MGENAAEISVKCFFQDGKTGRGHFYLRTKSGGSCRNRRVKLCKLKCIELACCGEPAPPVEKPVENVENFVISTAIWELCNRCVRKNTLYKPLHKRFPGVFL